MYWNALIIRCLLLHLLIDCFILESGRALRIIGTWRSGNRIFSILAKFGFQQIDPLDAEHSRGFIYGNVSSADVNGGARGVLLIVPRTHIDGFLAESALEQSCHSLLQNISLLAFDAKCFPKGKGDVMRWIPCPVGKLCVEEELPEKVVVGSQMTLRIEEPSTPQYWYVLLVACYLDAQCLWKSSVDEVAVEYDLWLTNGSPMMRYLNPFGHQFSFEEQNSAEMYILFLLLYLVIAFCQWRSMILCNRATVLSRHKLLNCIIALQTSGLSLHCVNVIVFAFDGQGILFARLLGEMARMMSVCLLCLLLILLSCGWSFGINSEISMYPITVVFWALLTAANFMLFFINFFFVDDILQDIDIFKSWPGYAMILIRMMQALWFLLAIHRLINQENDEDKAVFLAHFGAGFLVWFVYIVGLGIIASYVSALWRFKMILAITTMANFAAVACLVHLFWPTSPNRNYFLADIASHRRFVLAHEDDDDFENLLISDSGDAEDTDSPVSDLFENI